MKDGSRISKMLGKLDYGTLDDNLELLEIAFGDLTRVSTKTGKNLVQELVSRKYDETKCSIALRTLFRKAGLNPNHLDKNGLNFVQTAINTGYSQNFVCDCIRQTLALGYDVNHQDNAGNTVIHSAINSTNFKEGFIDILKLVDVNGYDVHLKNENGKEISDLVFESNKYAKIDKMKYIKDMYGIVSRPKNLKVHGPKPKF
jgi:hypothetical protein